MSPLPNSFTLNLLEISSIVDSLETAISNSDRANIVRACSNLLYSVSDLLEQTIPDGVSITIK